MVRIDNLTGIRGFAAIWVAMFHFRTTPIVSSLSLGPILGDGPLGVDIFFVLSGLILSINYAPQFEGQELPWKSFNAFLLKRFARVYPLHIATFLVMVGSLVIATIAGITFPGLVHDNWWTAICNVLMVHAWGLTKHLSWNTPSWSISAEWFAYLFVFPYCVVVMRRFSVTYCIGVATVAWLLFLAVVVSLYSGDITHITTFGILRIIPEFIAGYVAYRITKAAPQIAWGNAVALGAIGTIIGITLLPPAAVCLLVPAIVVLLIGLHTGGTFVDAIFGNRVVVFLGEISYSIYLIHLMIQIAVKHAVLRSGMASTSTNGVLILLVEVFLTIAGGYVGYVMIELPARRAIVKRLGRRQLAPAA